MEISVTDAAMTQPDGRSPCSFEEFPKFPMPKTDKSRCTAIHTGRHSNGTRRRRSGRQKSKSDDKNTAGRTLYTRPRYRRYNKPPYTYTALIAASLWLSPGSRLSLRGILASISRMFPFFSGEYRGWEESIRHSLTQEPCFSKVLRDPLRPSAKCNEWTVDWNLVPQKCFLRQNKRPRKRQAPPQSGATGGGESQPEAIGRGEVQPGAIGGGGSLPDRETLYAEDLLTELGLQGFGTPWNPAANFPHPLVSGTGDPQEGPGETAQGYGQQAGHYTAPLHNPGSLCSLTLGSLCSLTPGSLTPGQRAADDPEHSDSVLSAALALSLLSDDFNHYVDGVNYKSDEFFLGDLNNNDMHDNNAGQTDISGAAQTRQDPNTAPSCTDNLTTNATQESVTSTAGHDVTSCMTYVTSEVQTGMDHPWWCTLEEHNLPDPAAPCHRPPGSRPHPGTHPHPDPIDCLAGTALQCVIPLHTSTDL